jgi:hypothetical protein
LRLEIVKRNEPHRFVVLPKRRIVERTLAWTTTVALRATSSATHDPPPPSFASP